MLPAETAQPPAPHNEFAPSTSEPASRMACLGPPPLLTGEDEAGYGDLLARVSAAVKPRDILEEIWLRDFLDLAWECLRYRRLKTALIDGAAAHGLAAVLDPLLRVRRANDEAGGIEPDSYLPSSRNLAEAWAAGDPAGVAKVRELLAAAGQGMDRAMAAALERKLDEVERIDRMLASAEARRNSVLHEIERHRATFGRALKQAVEQAEAVDLEVIETRPLAPCAVAPAEPA